MMFSVNFTYVAANKNRGEESCGTRNKEHMESPLKFQRGALYRVIEVIILYALMPNVLM